MHLMDDAEHIGATFSNCSVSSSRSIVLFRFASVKGTWIVFPSVFHSFLLPLPQQFGVLPALRMLRFATSTHNLAIPTSDLIELAIAFLPFPVKQSRSRVRLPDVSWKWSNLHLSIPCPSKFLCTTVRHAQCGSDHP